MNQSGDVSSSFLRYPSRYSAAGIPFGLFWCTVVAMLLLVADFNSMMPVLIVPSAVDGSNTVSYSFFIVYRTLLYLSVAINPLRYEVVVV